uniref:Uncharacterized protein n=1 Tax=Monopterus albus TaxID=43700 RepID=A0A3Q3J4B2_MONAL
MMLINFSVSSANSMCDQPKIHIFLGAPSSSSGLALVPKPGLEGEDHPPAEWSHLELTWMDGRLRPATDEAGNPARSSAEEEPTDEKDQGDQTNTGREGSGSKADWTSEASRGWEKPAGPTDEELNPEKEDQCSASVLEYLDSYFPAAQPEKPEPESPHRSEPSPAVPPLSIRTQYLTTWTLSGSGRGRVQAAAGRENTLPPQTQPKHTQTLPSVSHCSPELFSPVTPSLEASAELCSQSCLIPREEEEGVVLQVTRDGVLCSQETARDSPSTSPDSKRARICKDYSTEVTEVESHSTVSSAGLRGATTLLAHCDRPGGWHSILVAVVHPCHLKEVKVKTGPSAGTLVPLASIVVTDQSAVEMKVVLWRRAAFWVLTLSPGDILLITGLQVNEDRWRGETVLQSTFSSKLLNLGQVTASTSPPAPQHVSARSLTSLCGFLRERHPLLVSLPHHPLQDLNRLPYATLRSLRVNTLVHALLRITHTHISTAWRSEAESRCRSAVQLKAVLTVEQAGGQQGTLLLWGVAVNWLPRFNQNKAAVWDFHILLVREGLTSDLMELHSTPWTSVQPLDPTDRRAQGFHPLKLVQAGNSSSVELDLDTLLSQKYSGDVELRVQVTAFHFQEGPPSQNAPQPVLDSSTPLAGILEALSGRCPAELDTDANGICGPCYPCLPHTGVRRYYRPGVLTVSGQGSRQVCVQVPPVPVQKILDAPPDKLNRRSAPGSEVKHIQLAAERIQSLLSLPQKTFIITVRSNFLCDENSVPIHQDLMLLDLQFPN